MKKYFLKRIGAFIGSLLFISSMLITPAFAISSNTYIAQSDKVSGSVISDKVFGNGAVSDKVVGPGGRSKIGITNPIGSGSLQEFMARILRIFVILGTMVVVFFIIYAGLQYVLARGDTTQIEAAHKTLWGTVVGAAIILGAEVIARVIEGTVKELAK